MHLQGEKIKPVSNLDNYLITIYISYYLALHNTTYIFILHWTIFGEELLADIFN